VLSDPQIKKHNRIIALHMRRMPAHRTGPVRIVLRTVRIPLRTRNYPKTLDMGYRTWAHNYAVAAHSQKKAS